MAVVLMDKELMEVAVEVCFGFKVEKTQQQNISNFNWNDGLLVFIIKVASLAWLGRHARLITPQTTNKVCVARIRFSRISYWPRRLHLLRCTKQGNFFVNNWSGNGGGELPGGYPGGNAGGVQDINLVK